MHYADKYWGVPETSDAAFIYYRTDKGGGAPPSTWQQVYAEAKTQGGIVYQGAPYEGLTCDYLELAFAAGGTVLNDDGKKSTINSPQNIKALQLMVDGIKNGAAPKAVTTYMEPRDRPGVDQRPLRLHAQLDLRLRRGQQERRARSRASTRSPRSRPSRAAARPASSAATTASSASTPRTRGWR